MTEAAWRGVGEQVAGELDALAAKDGLLDPEKHGSFQRYGGSMPTGHRARIQAAVREQYLADGDSLVVREHRAAIVTAGPPGAGKSTAIKSIPDAEGYRRLDPDEIKDLLIRQALRDGDYAAQLAHVLADGHQLLPREMSQLFHAEALQITDQIRGICLRRGENIVLEGTLSWRPLAGQLVGQLDRADYQQLTVVSVDVDHEEAHSRAMGRWWEGRQAAITGVDPLGGRYINITKNLMPTGILTAPASVRRTPDMQCSLPSSTG